MLKIYVFIIFLLFLKSLLLDENPIRIYARPNKEPEIIDTLPSTNKRVNVSPNKIINELTSVRNKLNIPTTLFK